MLSCRIPYPLAWNFQILFLKVLTEELHSPGKGFLDDYLRHKIIMEPLDLVASVKSFLRLPGLVAKPKMTSEAASGPEMPDKMENKQNKSNPPKP